jgi:hypothetical protein
MGAGAIADIDFKGVAASFGLRMVHAGADGGTASTTGSSASPLLACRLPDGHYQ